MPSVIGMRSPLRLRVEAKMKSDHAHRKANRETVTIELRLIGRMIERKIRQVPAPSIRAACIISLGMPAMKAVNSSTPKGRSEEHTSELQSRGHLVCRLLLEKKQK